MKTAVHYLKYLWRSTNEHGVHSPFVFDLVTKALRFKGNLTPHPLVKELPFYPDLPRKYKRAVNNALHHLFGKNIPHMVPASNHYTAGSRAELVYWDHTTPYPSLEIEALLNSLPNDTVLLIRKHTNTAPWNALTQHPEIHLTIDCNQFGMAWKRAQQAKENFTIRL